MAVAMDRRVPAVAVVVLLFVIYCHGKAVRNFVPGYKAESDFAGGMVFKYDRGSHYIITRLDRHYDRCFAYNTTYQDRIDVHTEEGSRKIEARILQLVALKADTLAPMTQDERLEAGRSIINYCRGHPVYLIN